MAGIEFITKRIEGKEKEIKKLEGKLARIKKAQATDWEVNPYCYDERDIKWTTRDLEAAHAALDEYRTQLAAETEKANSRNVPAILEFLADWKVKVLNYYDRTFPVYLNAKKERYAQNREYCEKVNYTIRDHAKREELRRTEREQEKQFRQMWSNFIKYDECDRFQREQLQKDLDRDAEVKYDDIIERTNKICGTITDAAGLRVGLKGDLDGWVKGERGTAKVQTIGAGGYNIQCYHFRTLVHEMK